MAFSTSQLSPSSHPPGAPAGTMLDPGLPEIAAHHTGLSAEAFMAFEAARLQAARGLPRSIQLAAGLYRDDLVLRAARAIEMAQPFPMPDLG